MVTQKKINIPIFDYKLTIIIFDKWEEVEHLFDGGPEPRAITKSQYGSSLVAVNSKRGSSIVHEAEHIKNNIWDFIGYSPHYCELFKSWFGDGVEQKIIESAVVFWFKDDDYKDGFKLWNYFKED